MPARCPRRCRRAAAGHRPGDRARGVIPKAAKETNPNCIVWLTCCDIHDPHIANSRALQETDWLLNEAGDLQRTADAKKMIGPHTRLITCLANWNKQDPMQIVPAALKEGIGLYGFSKPGADSLLPLEAMLASSFSAGFSMHWSMTFIRVSVSLTTIGAPRKRPVASTKAVP